MLRPLVGGCRVMASRAGLSEFFTVVIQAFRWFDCNALHPVQPLGRPTTMNALGAWASIIISDSLASATASPASSG